jgi:hypothetical protein
MAPVGVIIMLVAVSSIVSGRADAEAPCAVGNE